VKKKTQTKKKIRLILCYQKSLSAIFNSTEKMSETIFDIFTKGHDNETNNQTEDIMKMDQFRDKPFLELAFHLHQLSTNSQHLIDEDDNVLNSNQYVVKLKELKLEELCDLFETIAYCNFNSSIALDQLIWITGETRKVHNSFFMHLKGKYQVQSIHKNQFVREELKKQLKLTPFNPYTYQCRFERISTKYLNNCIRFGNLKLMKWTIQTHNIQPTQKGIRLACLYGHLKIVTYLYETFNIIPSEDAIKCAYENGHLKIVQYINETFKIEPTSNHLNCACRNNHSTIIHYVHKSYGIKPNLIGANWACEGGHLELIQHLYTTFELKPNYWGSDLACFNGHLMVVKYLFETFKITPRSLGIESACFRGDLHLIQYLIESIHIEPTLIHVELALLHHQKEIAQYLKNQILLIQN
jgi:hypothetical protein